jgi:predicted nucleic acid-binding protein
MRGRRCTIDSSCVIALDHAGLIPKLSVLFSKVLVPKAVREELFKRRVTKDRLQSIFANYAFVERCDGYDQGAVDLLLLEQSRQGGQDRGEAEALVQAAQAGAVVVIDDRWGRDLAARYDLDCHGTLWVLEQLHQTSLVSGKEIREAVQSMRHRGIRLPWTSVDEMLVRIGERPLPPFRSS